MARKADARTRPALLKTAGQLFYSRGVTATSVDDVAEMSGLTKPTLYRHFPSKEALIAAYLEERHEALDHELRTRLAERPAKHRPRALVEWLCDWLTRPGFNGCAFARTFAELLQEWVLEKLRGRKQALLETIEQACADAEVPDPSGLARQLLLIVEGATTMAVVSGDPEGAADTAKSLADAALAIGGANP